MLAPQNQDLRQILIHLPCLAVRCPVLRELIGVPYFSGLTANFPPSKRLFLQKKFRGVCVYLLISPLSQLQKSPLALILHGLDGNKKDQPSRLILYILYFAIWSRTSSLIKSTRLSNSSSQLSSKILFPSQIESVVTV